MRLKSIILSVVLLLSFGIYAQTELECKTNLSNAHVATQAKNYDAAYGPWLYVKKNCPGLNLATYADGEKIMKYKIETLNQSTSSKETRIHATSLAWK